MSNDTHCQSCKNYQFIPRTNFEQISLRCLFLIIYHTALGGSVATNHTEKLGGCEDDDEDEAEPAAASTAEAVLRDCKYHLHVTMMASNRCLKARKVFAIFCLDAHECLFLVFGYP